MRRGLIAAVVFAIALVILAALVHSALSGIYAAALYRYASGGTQTQGFDPNMLQQAFLPKK